MTMFAATASLGGAADDMAWGDVAADGSLETRSLDVPVATARGAQNFFIPNPMDSHDWSHTSVVRNSLFTELNGTSAKVKMFEEALRPIFSAMPKDAEGRLNSGTARYALHRHFSQKHGWSIKGLEPAGAAWLSSASVTPDVKDITKYMVPSYLQQLLAQRLGVSGFDLHSLSTLAAVIEHMIHAETISYVYSIFTTLGLPIPGRRTEKEVDDIVDTFMMVFAFGINLDVSILADVQKAKAHLEKSHSGWPQLQSFAKEVKQGASVGRELDFAGIVQLVEKISQGYAKWQGKDCKRVKDELTAKPSYQEGRVQLSEVKASHAAGGRSLFMESFQDFEKLGVLSEGSEAEARLIIPNYVNSQSMCLSTASMYTVCCVNECDGLLSSLEREVGGPSAEPAQLARLVAALPGLSLGERLILDEFQGLVDASGQISLHGPKLASWMHRAFPLECPAPLASSKIANPKTPDEWIGESENLEVKNLEDMISEVADVLARYTTMGKEAGAEILVAEDPVSDPSVDVVSHVIQHQQNFLPQSSQPNLISTIFRLAAMLSMMGIVGVAAKSALKVTISSSDKLQKGLKLDRDFV